MSVALKKHIEELEEEQESLLEVKQDIADTKADISVGAIVSLLKAVKGTLEELTEGQVKTVYYDKNLGETLASAISEFTKMDLSAKINFNPNVNVDLKPIQALANNISEQNKTIITFLEKLSTPNGQQNEGLYNLICSMIEKNNAFLDKGMKQIDYKSELKEISKSIPARIKKWEFVGFRDERGKITITATAKE